MEHTLHAHKEQNPAKHKKIQQKQNINALFWTHTIHTTPITHTLIYPNSITISVVIFGTTTKQQTIFDMFPQKITKKSVTYVNRPNRPNPNK